MTETTETTKTIQTTGVKIGAWLENDGSNVYGIMISLFAAAVSERMRQQRENKEMRNPSAIGFHLGQR